MTSLTPHADAARTALAQMAEKLPPNTGDPKRDFDRTMNIALMDAVMMECAKGLDGGIPRADVAACLANAAANALASAVATLAQRPDFVVIAASMMARDLGGKLIQRAVAASAGEMPEGSELVSEEINLGQRHKPGNA